MVPWSFIVRDHHSLVDSCDLTNKIDLHASAAEVQRRLKLWIFGHYAVKAKLFCQDFSSGYLGLSDLIEKFHAGCRDSSVTGLAAFRYEHIEILTKEIGMRQDLGNRDHMKRPLLTAGEGYTVKLRSCQLERSERSTKTRRGQ